MWDQDFELIEDSTDGASDEVTIETEWIDDSANAEKVDEVPNTTSTKSKKSNFKKLSKLNKALKAENKKLREQAERNNNDDDDDYDFEEDEAGEFDRTEFRFFTIENPEAKDFSEDIEAIVTDNPNMSFEDALLFAKAKRPKTSTSSNDFNTTSANTKVRKKLADLSRDEALKLDNTKYLEWARLKWEVK